jgi:hypothetical protein
MLHRINNRIENRPVKMKLPALAGCHTTDDIGSVFNHLQTMKRAFPPGETLNDHSRVLIH